MFDFLHPQTIALIVSHMKPNLGAAIVSGLPPEKQYAVIQSIATIQPTNPDVMEKIKKDFENWLSCIMNQELECVDGLCYVAKMLRHLTACPNIMKNLKQNSPKLFDVLCRLLPDGFVDKQMFVFEDIAKLHDVDVLSILRNTEVDLWKCVLRGASDDLKEKIFKNMSKRAAKILQEDMECFGTPEPSDIAQGQQKIVDICLLLYDAGEVTLPQHGNVTGKWRSYLVSDSSHPLPWEED